MDMLVSVIIPVFNYAKYLKEAINSVFEQSYRPLEVIVVDDGSTDGSGEIACSFAQVRYIRQQNQGVAVARNTGLAAARGELIAFLDADDSWLTDKLKIQAEYLKNNPGTCYTIGRIRNFADSGIDLSMMQPVSADDQIGLATIVARKEIFDRVGNFDPRYRVGEDLEWFTRAKDEGIPMAILPDILLNRRIHQCNLSIMQPQACHASRLQIMKESIERQRKKKAENHGTS